MLDVSPEVAAERRRRRRGGGEIFDSDELQTRLCEFYRGLERYFPDERIVHVESDGELDVVAARVLAHAQELARARDERAASRNARDGAGREYWPPLRAIAANLRRVHAACRDEIALLALLAAGARRGRVCGGSERVA